MIKLLAVDLDGTVVRSDGTISERVRRALAGARAAGIRLCVATGRVRTSVADLGQDFTICHGGTIVLEGAAVLHRVSLTVEQTVRAWRWAKESGVDGVFFADDCWSANHRGEQVEALARFLKAEPLGEPAWEVPLARLRCSVARLAPAFADLHLEQEGDWTYLRGAPADKGTGLRLLVARLGLAPDAVACMGDELNDLPMFAVAGHRIAPANARPEVRAVATAVVPSVAEDGAAVWLEDLCGGKAGGRPE